MKREKVNSIVEEKIITGMITSKEFLSQIAPGLDVNLFSANHFRTIAGWCVKYFNRYQKAPAQEIETMYHSWVEKGKAKEEVVEAVHDVLEKLSEDYDDSTPSNIPYLLDEASEHLSLRKIEVLRDTLDISLLEKDCRSAETHVNSFRNIKLGANTGIDMFADTEALKTAFSEQQKPLFSVGDVGCQRFWQHALCRDNLIGILAPEKRGKTFWCCEFSIRALMARRKVAMFQVGDMSQNQILKRMAVRITGKPMFKNQCGYISVPKRIIKQDNGRVRVKRKQIKAEHPVSEKASAEAIKKFQRRFGISNKHPSFMISCHPNSSVNVQDIFGILEKWEYENDFVPDVIIIDYADILAPEPNSGGYDSRDKINETWKALRRLSQEKHCLVIAPTQADAASYDLETITAKNFSEDKRKLSHVTGMLGLNQNPEEKQAGIMRLNWVVLREAPFSTDKCLYVGQCLALARSFCCGYY